MGTRVSRSARPAAGAAGAEEAEDEEHYRVPSSPQFAESGADAGDDERRHLPVTEAGGAHYRVPVPVGCEQLV